MFSCFSCCKNNLSIFADSMISIKNYINGVYCEPISGKYFDNYNPALGIVYAQVPDSDSRDVTAAVFAAKAAFSVWSATPAEDKFRILNKIAELIETNADELAKAESKDQGKPVWLAKNEMKRAAQNFRFFATA